MYKQHGPYIHKKQTLQIIKYDEYCQYIIRFDIDKKGKCYWWRHVGGLRMAIREKGLGREKGGGVRGVENG